VDPRSGLDDVEKREFLTLLGLELRPLGRPAVASRYTDYVIPAPKTQQGPKTSSKFTPDKPLVHYRHTFRERRSKKGAKAHPGERPA
jgi:hypothetical protein